MCWEDVLRVCWGCAGEGVLEVCWVCAGRMCWGVCWVCADEKMCTGEGMLGRLCWGGCAERRMCTGGCVLGMVAGGLCMLGACVCWGHVYAGASVGCVCVLLGCMHSTLTQHIPPHSPVCVLEGVCVLGEIRGCMYMWWGRRGPAPRYTRIYGCLYSLRMGLKQ